MILSGSQCQRQDYCKFSFPKCTLCCSPLLQFSRPNLRAEAVFLGFRHKRACETVVLSDEAVSQRYGLSSINVCINTTAQVQWVWCSLDVSDSCCIDGWCLQSKYDAVRTNQTYCTWVHISAWKYRNSWKLTTVTNYFEDSGASIVQPSGDLCATWMQQRFVAVKLVVLKAVSALTAVIFPLVPTQLVSSNSCYPLNLCYGYSVAPVWSNTFSSVALRKQKEHKTKKTALSWAVSSCLLDMAAAANTMS